jgi:ABC-type bacteriocin/lantibiotic exporter with double-glycine peptidase domain
MNQFQTGDLLSRIFTDAGDMGERLGQRAVLFFAGFFQTAIVLSLLFYYNWFTALCVTIIYPIYFVVIGIVNKKITKCVEKVREKQAKTQHLLLKGIEGFLNLVVLRKQEYYANIYSKSLNDTSKQFYKYNFLSSLNVMLSNFICSALPVIAVILCTYSSLHGDHDVLLIYILAGYLLQPLNSLSNTFQYMNEDKALEKRMCEVLEFPQEEGNGLKLEDIVSVEVHIEQYILGNKSILQNCNFSVKKGEFLTIRGESGCGKSSLLKLLMKQLPDEAQGVSILLNNISIAKLDKKSLYEQIGYVNQTHFVFEDTLKNNLCMGNEYSIEEIHEALRISCLSDFVDEYGLDHMILENAQNISVGQLQRICIARSLLRKPKCLLLDEPTSALDEQTSIKLMSNIYHYVKENNAIAICVTHKHDVREDYGTVIQL